MREMHVPDDVFVRLLARWILQSKPGGRHSGGRSCDEPAEDDTLQVASMEPVRNISSYKDFDRSWKKAPYFEHAKHLMGPVITAISMARGKGFWKQSKGLRYWYVAGTRSAKYFAPYIAQLLERDEPLMLYGRDCMPMWRMLYNYSNKSFYAEGMSRPVLQYRSLCSCISDWDRCQKCIDETSGVTSRFIIGILPGNLDAVELFHVDTGFRGTVPKTVCKYLGIPVKGYLLSGEDTLFVSSKLKSLTPDTRYSLTTPRDNVVKMEYRPKPFYRPTKWVNGRPELLVSSDAHYAAAYMVGFMAYSKSHEMKKHAAKAASRRSRYGISTAGREFILTESTSTGSTSFLVPTTDVAVS